MATILVAGSAVIDFVFMLDEMPRLAEKYRARDAMITGGGCAGNAAVAVARLGGVPVLVVPLGDDEPGDMIVSGLKHDGVDCSAISRLPGRRSSFSSVIIDAKGDRQIVNYRDPVLARDISWLPDLSDMSFDAVLADTRWPLIAGAVMREALDRGIPGVLDGEAPIAPSSEALTMATHAAFSAQGLADLTGVRDIEEGLRRARDTISGFVCATDGAHGTFHLEGDTLVQTPSFPVTAVDTLGAGDVWHGAFALSLAEGQSEIEAIRFASAAAAIKCSRAGGRSGYPTRADVIQFIKDHGL